MADLIGSFLNIFAVGGQKDVVRANNRVAKANAQASNSVRTARNGLSAAQGNLARWAQSVNNNRALKAGGEALEAGLVNLRRNQDALLTQSFGQSIQEAEQAGAMAAAAASAGVDGGVVDMVNQSTALRDSIVRQNVVDKGDKMAYDSQRRAGNIMSQMVGGLDNSLILDNLDYNRDTAQLQAMPSRAPAVIDFAINAAKTAAGAGMFESRDASIGFDYAAPQAQASFKKFEFNSNPDYYGNTEIGRTIDPNEGLWTN